MRTAVLVGMAALAVSVVAGPAFGQVVGGSPFERDFGDVKYLDSYFGTFESKAEVAPGDRNVPFTVVLANVGTHDITGVAGDLSLPLGFSPADGRGFLARADSNTNSRAGEIFHLTFYLDVEPYAEIQQYPAAAKVEYSRLRESGVRNAFFDFYFKVPGSGVLEMKAPDPFLMSLQVNTVRIEIANAGTAPLSNLDISTLESDTQMTQNIRPSIENVVVYESSWEVGNIDPISSQYIDVTVYVPETLKGETLRLPLRINYFNAHGDGVTETRVIDLYVRGLIDLTVYGIDVITISDTTMVVGEIINEGNEDALFSFVSVDPLGSSNIASQTQFIDEIDTDSPVPFNIPLEFEGEPVYGEHDIEVTVRYKDDLREEHFLTHQSTIAIPEPPPPRSDSLIAPLNGGVPPGDSMVVIIAAAAVIIAIAIAIVAVRRRRS